MSRTDTPRKRKWTTKVREPELPEKFPAKESQAASRYQSFQEKEASLCSRSSKSRYQRFNASIITFSGKAGSKCTHTRDGAIRAERIVDAVSWEPRIVTIVPHNFNDDIPKWNDSIQETNAPCKEDEPDHEAAEHVREDTQQAVVPVNRILSIWEIATAGSTDPEHELGRWIASVQEYDREHDIHKRKHLGAERCKARHR